MGFVGWFPFLLNETSRYHISKNANAVDDPEFVRKLLESFYVDDYVGEDHCQKTLPLCMERRVKECWKGVSSLESGSQMMLA